MIFNINNFTSQGILIETDYYISNMNEEDIKKLFLYYIAIVKLCGDICRERNFGLYVKHVVMTKPECKGIIIRQIHTIEPIVWRNNVPMILSEWSGFNEEN